LKYMPSTNDQGRRLSLQEGKLRPITGSSLVLGGGEAL
jgi:hypothetical protein